VKKELPIQLRIKPLHPDARRPVYASDGAAAFDLHVVGAAPVRVFPGVPVAFGTGLAVEVPEGYGLFIFSRSGHGFNFGARLANCVGVIDSDYRGEVMVKIAVDAGNHKSLLVNPGDRIAQAVLLPVPRVEFTFTDQLTETARGAAGLGSTGAA
jgi:dUTP pyrophosphatase